MYRQGDVLIIPLPPDARLQPSSGLKPVERDHGRVVLAYGEVTGHAHAIADDGVELFDFVASELPPTAVRVASHNDNSERLLVVEKGAALRHEEHDEIRLPAGRYIVRQQRQYVPGGSRLVAD